MGFKSNFAKQATASQNETLSHLDGEQPPEKVEKTTPVSQALAQPSQPEAGSPTTSVVNAFEKKPHENTTPNNTLPSQEAPSNHNAINPDEKFDTKKLFKLIESVGPHLKLSPAEISAVKRRAINPQESRKIYLEYTQILTNIQTDEYNKNVQSRQASPPVQASTASPSSNQNSTSTQTQSSEEQGFYEFKILNNGKVQSMKKSKGQYPEFEYYHGCTVEYVPASSTVFKGATLAKKAKM